MAPAPKPHNSRTTKASAWQPPPTEGTTSKKRAKRWQGKQEPGASMKKSGRSSSLPQLKSASDAEASEFEEVPVEFEAEWFKRYPHPEPGNLRAHHHVGIKSGMSHPPYNPQVARELAAYLQSNGARAKTKDGRWDVLKGPHDPLSSSWSSSFRGPASTAGSNKKAVSPRARSLPATGTNFHSSAAANNHDAAKQEDRGGRKTGLRAAKSFSSTAPAGDPSATAPNAWKTAAPSGSSSELPKGLWYEEWAMAGKPVPVPGDDEIQRWFQDLRFQSRLTNEEMEEFDPIELGDLTIYHGPGSRSIHPSLLPEEWQNASMKKLKASPAQKLKELGSSLKAIARDPSQASSPRFELSRELPRQMPLKKRVDAKSNTFGSGFRDTSYSLSNGEISSKRMLYLAERMKDAGPNRLAMWAKATGISTRTGRKLPQVPLAVEAATDISKIYERALGSEPDGAFGGMSSPSSFVDSAEHKKGQKENIIDFGPSTASSDRAATAIGKAAARESLTSAGAQLPMAMQETQEMKTRRRASRSSSRRRKSQVAGWVGNNSFETCVFLSKKHHLPLAEVRDRLKEYRQLDVNRDGGLSASEFMRAIKLRANIPEDKECPSSFFDSSWLSVDKDGSGEIDFEEYLLWCVNHQWSEELCVTNTEDREMRRIAREYGFVLPDVEGIKSVFDRFDVDKSGQIDESEFRGVLIQLMKIDVNDVPTKKLKQYFREVDGDGSGEVSFEEFVVWYISVYLNSQE